MLLHTTDWDGHWGGHETLKVNLRGITSPRSAVVDLATEAFRVVKRFAEINCKNEYVYVFSLCLAVTAAPLRHISGTIHLWVDFLSSVNHIYHLLLATYFDSMNFEIDLLRLPWVPHGPQGFWWWSANTYFSFLWYTKQLLLLTFCDKPAGSDKKLKWDVRTDRRRK